MFQFKEESHFSWSKVEFIKKRLKSFETSIFAGADKQWLPVQLLPVLATVSRSDTCSLANNCGLIFAH